MTRSAVEPRMLTQAQAAYYCGMGVKAFKAACPITATQLRHGLLRYDRYRLDTWLDSLGAEAGEAVGIDWLETLQAARVGK